MSESDVSEADDRFEGSSRSLVTAYEKGIQLLARREHGVGELKRKLRQKGYPDSEIEPAIENLLENRYLSNARYFVARTRALLRQGYGPGYIRQELSREGAFASDLIENEMNDLGLSEEGMILDWIEKKARRGGDMQKMRRRLVSFLIRKGFQSDQVFRLLTLRGDASGAFRVRRSF